MSVPIPHRALAVRIAAAGVLSAAVIATGACAAPEPEPQNTFEQQALTHENLIAACMKDRGFDYRATLDAETVAEIARQDAVAKGEDGEAAYEQALAAAPPDVNEALVAALPEDQQVLWGDALYGTDTLQGCHDLTYAEAWGATPEELTRQMEEFNAEVAAEPDVVAAVGVYVECMAAAGYTVPHPDQIETVIGEQVAGLDEQESEVYGNAMYDAHQTCAGPYDEAFAAAYERLAATG